MKASARRTRTLVILALVAASTFGPAACVRIDEDFAGRVFDAIREDPGLPGLPTDRPDITRAYLQTLRFLDVARISTITCHNGRTVDLKIHPELRSHLLDPNHARTRGRIVAKVVNVGTYPCDDLKLAAGDTAFWWMGPDRKMPLTTNFYRIPRSGPVRHDAFTNATLVYADTLGRVPDARISPFPAHPMRVRPPGDDGDGGVIRLMHLSTWIECLGACCESTQLEATP